MKSLASTLTTKMVNYKIIPVNEFDVYLYGLEILLSSSLTSISILIIATLVDSLHNGILYLIFSIPLRSTAGGYHASTYHKCFFISNLIYIFICLINKNTYNYSIYFWITLLYLSTLYIFYKAPVPNAHHPISKAQLKKNKKLNTLFLILFCTSLTLLLYLQPISNIVRIPILTIASVAIMIIPTQMKGGHKK